MEKHNVPGMQDPLPAIAGKCGGHLVIIGSGQCTWEDTARAFKLFENAGVKPNIMAINVAFLGLEWLFRNDKIDINHFVSLHKEYLTLRDIYVKGRCKTHCTSSGPFVDYVWQYHGGGSSGLFALKVGLLLGYSKIVICGIPVDDTPRFYDPPWVGIRSGIWDRAVLLEWDSMRHLASKIKSMSGNSKKVFGEPTEEWIRK